MDESSKPDEADHGDAAVGQNTDPKVEVKPQVGERVQDPRLVVKPQRIDYARNRSEKDSDVRK